MSNDNSLLLIDGELGEGTFSDMQGVTQSELITLRTQIEELKMSLNVKQSNAPCEGATFGSDNIVQTMPFHYFQGGNPLQIIPMFNGDQFDKTEVERFVNTLTEVANELKWSDTYRRFVLESKLTNKVKSTYFNGLGINNDLTFPQRLKEFTRLFSRKLNSDETMEQFFACHQLKDESVIAYKLRLIGLSSDLKLQLIESPKTYQMMMGNQFKKGLNKNIRLDIEKSGLTSFEEMVESAYRLEKIYDSCTIKGGAVGAITKKDNGIDELKGQISELKESIKKIQCKEEKQLDI